MAVFAVRVSTARGTIPRTVVRTEAGGAFVTALLPCPAAVGSESRALILATPLTTVAVALTRGDSRARLLEGSTAATRGTVAKLSCSAAVNGARRYPPAGLPAIETYFAAGAGVASDRSNLLEQTCVVDPCHPVNDL